MIKSKRLTGGQAAIKSLKKEKVKHVFGLIGSATMEIFDALYHEKKLNLLVFEMKERERIWPMDMQEHLINQV